MKVRNELNYQLFLQKTSGIQRQPMNVEMEQYNDICNVSLDSDHSVVLNPGNCQILHQDHES